MDESLVFHKTELGQDEIARPGGGLSPKLRRCLILVDGEKSVAELGAMFRAGEIGPIVKDLQAGGYIEAEGGGSGGAALDAEGVAVNEANFASVRQRAMREVSDRLGPNGDPLAMKISACESPDELRPVLREAARIMGQFLGPEFEKAFLTRIGTG